MMDWVFQFEDRLHFYSEFRRAGYGLNIFIIGALAVDAPVSLARRGTTCRARHF